MKRRKFRKNKLPILASFLIILTIPLAVYAILNIESLDTRNQASQGDTGYASQCTITFPYVNPETIEIGKTIQIQADAFLPDEIISSIILINRSGETIFEKQYDKNFERITELFEYTSTEIGDIGILGTVTTELGSYPCSLSQGSTMRILAINLAPSFKTTPSTAQPSNAIKVGDSYQYQLTAEDQEEDTINYSYSFTPNADWLQKSVIEDGGDGSLVLKFAGTPDTPASYLANVFIHDGYNAHLSSQSWVISVEQKDNDIPTVTVFEPAKDIEVSQGENVKVSWETSDLNKITKYEIYLSTNPGNENTWIPIDTNLSNKVGNYIFNTSSLLPGTYQFIVKATDNFSPPATGFGLSPKIAISTELTEEQPEAPDDGISLQEAQIINISPSNKSDIRNRKATISATLIAASGEKINKESILFKLDGNDLSDKLKLSDLSDSETTIIYTPEEEYTFGLHKITLSFTDSADNKIEKEWTFEIVEDDGSDDEIITIFGYEIAKRTAMIIAGGIVIVILAIIIPWLLYLAWKGGDEDYSSEYASSTPPTTPMTNSSYDSYYDYSSKESSYTPPESTTPTAEPTPPIDGLGYTEPTPVEEPVTTTTVEETTTYVEPEQVTEPETVTTPVEETTTETVSYDFTEPQAEPATVIQPETVVKETTKITQVVEETPEPIIESTPKSVTQEEAEMTGITELANQLEQLKEEDVQTTVKTETNVVKPEIVIEETPEPTPIITETPADTPYVQPTTTFNAPKPNGDTSAK